jgi:hypothetical protein
VKLPEFNVQGVIAITVIVGSFLLVGVYVIRGETPDAVIIGLVSGAVMAILGFYFGHSNGTTSALATAATTLANQVTAASNVQQGVQSVGPTSGLPNSGG